MSTRGFTAKLLVTAATIFCMHLEIALADQIVLKSGKIIDGKKVTETDLAIVIRDEKGLFVNIQKSDIDQAKTGAANRSAADKPGKTQRKGRVVTKEDLEGLREKHDLGLKSYGEAYELQWSSYSKVSEDPASNPEFEREVLSASTPVLVDFYADWCQPCRVIAPRVDAIAIEFEGKARVYRVNIDEEESLAHRYDIHAIPTLLFFKDGKIVDRIVGAVAQNILADKLRALL